MASRNGGRERPRSLDSGAVKAILALALVLALPAAAGATEAQAGGAVARPVERLYDTILQAMREAARLDVGGRADLLRPVVMDVYDLGFMAQKVLGAGWTRLSPEDQERWVDAFSRLTVSTYAHRFGPWAGERFEVLGSEPSSRDTMLVRTHIIPADGDPVAVDYRLMESGGAWRIVDVYLNGTVSELALRRSEYASVLRRDGFPALLTSIEAKIRDPGEED